MAAFVGVDGVLVAGELAAVETLVGVLCAEGESLSTCCGLTEGVCNIQILPGLEKYFLHYHKADLHIV